MWEKIKTTFECSYQEYFLTNSNELEYFLLYLYCCWKIVLTNKRLKVEKKFLNKNSIPVMKDIINDITPHLKESDKLERDECLDNIQNLLEYSLHRKKFSQKNECVVQMKEKRIDCNYVFDMTLD